MYEKYPKKISGITPDATVRPTGAALFPPAKYPARQGNPESNPPEPIALEPGYLTTPTVSPNLPPERLVGFRSWPIALDNAVADGVIHIVGNVLWVPWSTNSTDVVFLQLNDASDFIPATRGWFVAGCQFHQVHYRIDTAVAGATFYLAYTTDPGVETVRIQ
ncbi:MAG TPA: hypothetical protein VIO16_05450 [Dehalococcoidia bacterium]